MVVQFDYFDFQSLPDDSPDVWAEASVALATEIIEQEDWGQGDIGLFKGQASAVERGD
jgi:hypothetical protein